MVGGNDRNAGRTSGGSARILLVMAASLLATSAFAQELKQQGFAHADKLLTELLALFIVVTILESAMSTIFQWRVYRMLFNARAVKTIFMIAAGWGVVRLFDYDVFSRILALAGVGKAEVLADTLKVSSSGYSVFLSSLVLAGGSAGINTLMQALGFRSAVQGEAQAPPLKEDEAWVSITIRRKRAIGAVLVHMDEIAAPKQESPSLLGVLDDRWAITKVFEMLLATPGRVPSYGGRKVKVGQSYRISASGIRVAESGAGAAPEPFQAEIYVGRFASRAVIDLVVTI